MRQRKLILKLAVLQWGCSFSRPWSSVILVWTNSTHKEKKELVSFRLLNSFGSVKGPKLD